MIYYEYTPMKKVLMISTLLLCSLVSLYSQDSAPEAVQGIIDLSVLGRENGLYPIRGIWGFHWHELLTEIPDIPGEWIKAPGNWASRGNHPARGYGSYTLVIEGLSEGKAYSLYVPEAVSAYRLFINGEEVSSNGRVGTDRKSSIPQFRPESITFSARGMRDEMVLQVSNYHYRKSGIWRNFYIGDPASIANFYTTKIVFASFLIGMMIFVSIYFLSFSFFRREEKAALFFGLLSLVFLFRLLTTGEQLLTHYFPAFPWELARRIEFLPFSLSAGFSMWYFYHLYPVEFNKKILIGYSWLAGALGAALILLPVRFSNYLIIPAEIILAAGLFYSFTVIIRASRERRHGSVIILVSMIALFISVINDILYSNQLIHTIYVSPMGFIFFMVSQSLMLSRRYAYSFRTIEDLTINLKDFNRSLSRFMPFRFFDYLNKDSVLELDSAVQNNITILYADIRSFTTLSEAMSAEENMESMKSFLSNVIPLIREGDGFADKYISDGLMALFPGSPDKALKTAVKLQGAVKDFNRQRHREGHPRLSLGIGLHSGGLLVGSLGSPEKAETSIISDTVNIARSMEKLSTEYGASIIISGNLYESLEKPDDFETRKLGTTVIKGKRSPISFHEVLEGLPESLKEIKVKTKPLFEEGLMNYDIMRYEEASALFKRVLESNPDDRAASIYLNLSLDRI